MLKNYFLIAIRTLQRNLGYSLINIIGLSIGLACSILIFFWVADELSYNKFHTNYNDLYKVYKNYDYGEGINTGFQMPYPLKEAIAAKSSDVKYIVMTNWGEGCLLETNGKKINQLGLSVSEDFLKMFTFPMKKGDMQTALNDPSSIVLTESTAKKLFGEKDPLNELIRIDSDRELKVTGVITDPPRQSSLTFEFLVPFEYYKATQPWVQRSVNSWKNNSFQLYIQLQPTAQVTDVNAAIKNTISDNYAEAKQTEVFLNPISNWRLYSEFTDGKPSGGQIEYVRIFSLIGIFILAIACINFMNLATARSESRAREVGIRKSVGSRRKQLIFQFLSESLMITFISFLAGVVLVELALPAYNSLVNKNISIDYSNPVVWAIAVSIILITGIISGSYPAFYLSSFRPAIVLKGKINAGQKGSLPRKIMVIAQFSFSIFLIIATISMYQQIMHLKARDIGYDRNNLMLIWTNTELETNFESLRTELVNTGAVQAVSKSNSPITRVFATNNAEWPGMDPDKKVSFTTIATEYDYTKTMDIKMLEGRDFSRDMKSDSSAVVINRAALEVMGFDNPIGEKITMSGQQWTIIGVMENVIMDSPEREIDPLVMLFDPTWSSTVSVRLEKTADLQVAIQKIEPIFKKLNPSNPFEYRFTDEEFEGKFSGVNLIGKVAGLFAGLSILITCLGLFGLAAFTAEQRTKELGIRKVMGATVSSLVLLISKDFSRLVVFAFIVAAPIAWWVMSGFLERYTYRISLAWWLLPAAGVFTLILALIIVSTQALKAAMNNPVNSLRND
jgi:putative ABC transport system permease protein